MTSYGVFRNHLSMRPKEILCPVCKAVMLTNVFERHCRDHHDTDPTVSCVFCRNFSWPRGCKKDYGRHLHQCLKKFIKDNRVPATTIVPEESILTEEICSCASFRSDELRRRSERIPEWTEREKSEGGVHLMYDRLFEYDAEWCRLPEYGDLVGTVYEEDGNAALLNCLKFHSWSGLDDSVEWIKRYVYHEKRFGWYHVFIRAGCTKSFVENLQGLDIVELPHWCVCRGRNVTDSERIDLPSEALKPSWRHHRHAILVVRDKAKFKRRLAKRVTYRLGVVPENGKRYYCHEIKDVGHFVSTIAYVSLSPSKCKCEEIESNGWVDGLAAEMKMLPNRRLVPKHSVDGCHYFIEKPVVPHAVMWMLLAAPSNALERYGQFRVGARPVENLKSKTLVDGKWYVSACDELGIRNCVVLFDNLHRRIGDVIDPGDWLNFLRNRCSSERWFVYWFGGLKLRVTKWNDGPDDVDEFREYSCRNKMNVLFNLRDNNFALPFRSQKMAKSLHTLEMKHRDYVKRLNYEHFMFVKRLNDEHEVYVKGLNDEHEAFVKQMNDEHEALVKRLDEEHEAFVKQLGEHEAFVKRLDEEHEQHIRDLQDDLKTERECKKKLEDKLEAIEKKYNKRRRIN